MIHKTLLLGMLATLTLSCSKSNPTPEKEPPTTTNAPQVVASTSASASAATIPIQAPKDVFPTLVPDKPLAGTEGFDFYPIEGAFIVVDGLKVGRYVDGNVEWIRSLPEMNQGLGGSHIGGVTGVWPDVDVRFSSLNGRASQPSVYPLTGKGNMIRFAPGGGSGWLYGTVRLGTTTLAAGTDMSGGSRFEVLRGPGVLIKPILAEKFGCDLSKIHGEGDEPIALPFSAVAVTGTGKLITVGNLCDDEKRPAFEIWDEPRKSHIVEVGHLLPKIGFFPRVLVGKGDEFWVESKGVLHYLDGKFDRLPLPTHALKNLFVSASGKLHGVADRELVRYDDGKWTTIAKVPRDANYSRMTMDEAGTIWISNRGISKLREAQGNEGDEPCTTPFVHLYDVAWGNENKYTFPTTRKALATFPDVTKIKLMEYSDWGRQLGIQVESEEQAAAVIKHVKANMKNEFPEFRCYFPVNHRIIDINGGK